MPVPPLSTSAVAALLETTGTGAAGLYLQTTPPDSSNSSMSMKTLVHIRRHPVITTQFLVTSLWDSQTLALYDTHQTAAETGTRYLTVASTSDPTATYRVSTDAHFCTCPSFLKGNKKLPNHQKTCIHLEAQQHHPVVHAREYVWSLPRLPLHLVFMRMSPAIPTNWKPDAKWLWSVKYDGIRVAINRSGYAATKAGLTIDVNTLLPTIHQIYDSVVSTLKLTTPLVTAPILQTALEATGPVGPDMSFLLDAELLMYEDTHETLPVRRLGHNRTMHEINNNRVTQLTLRIFDVIDPTHTFADRHAALLAIAPEVRLEHVVQQTVCDENMATVITDVLGRGHEGVIVRSSGGLYLHNKTSNKLAFKIKAPLVPPMRPKVTKHP